MNITPFIIKELVSFVNGDENPPRRSGPKLIELFNRFGARDVYDELGMPDIGKRNGQRPARKEYSKNRLQKLSGSQELRELLQIVFNELEDNQVVITGSYNWIINAEFRK